MKRNEGITLIALIITIIVLIILAGVTINVLFGGDGILNKAKEGAEDYKTAEQNEIEELSRLENELNLLIGGGSTPEPEEQLKKNGDWEEGKGVNSPDIEGGLTAIYYDGTEWLELTETSSTEEWNNWYNYEAQTETTETGGTSRWANASTANGSMLVWIPRYEYKITRGEHGKDLSKDAQGYLTEAGTIEINFIRKETIVPTSEYTIHPAFTNSGNGGLGELAGIWVGKFESSTENGRTGTNGDKVKIVPNVNPWRSINISTAFSRSQEFASNNSLSGYDSHMMKNSEWGAVAYLAHSKYGRNGTEITINNKYDGSSLDSLRTGYAGYTVNASYNNEVREINDVTSTTGVFPYNNTYRGVLASTTGNVYGIYDMSGGARERVMGNYSNTIGSSGFGEIPETKYCDQYTTYAGCSTIKGDAIYETSLSAGGNYGWHGDYAYFVYSGDQWLVRGGLCNEGIHAGLFYFSSHSGGANTYYSFRVVCTK